LESFNMAEGEDPMIVDEPIARPVAMAEAETPSSEVVKKPHKICVDNRLQTPF
jgi:hypothetical protein